MSCHSFTNLRELFQGDLSGKLRTSGSGTCGCNNMRRNSIAVCKVKCNNTGKTRMGNTQQKFKARMQQQVQKLVKLGEKLDSHAKHFATQFRPRQTNLGEQPAASSGKATQTAQSKLLLPKTVHCVLWRELKFLNSPDQTHNFLSAPTTKPVVPVGTCHVSTGM